jgi:hypothetical protein
VRGRANAESSFKMGGGTDENLASIPYKWRLHLCPMLPEGKHYWVGCELTTWDLQRLHVFNMFVVIESGY